MLLSDNIIIMNNTLVNEIKKKFKKSKSLIKQALRG